MNIFFIVDDYPPQLDGIGDHAQCLANAMADQGAVITVLTKQGDEGLATHKPGVNVRREISAWTWAEVRRIARMVKDFAGETIVHLYYPSRSNYDRRLAISFLPGLLRLTCPNIPVFLTAHGYHEHRLRWRLRVMPMLVSATQRVFVHHQDLEQVSRLLPCHRFPSTIIPIGSNIPAADELGAYQAREELGFTATDRVLVYFGGMRAEKGLLDLVYALRWVRQMHPVKLLVVCGYERPSTDTDYGRSLHAALRHADMEGWVTFASSACPRRTAEFLKAADLAVFPFVKGAAENRGSLLAAITNGVPVLTTRGPSTPPQFEDDFGVETVPAGDQFALRMRIHRLLSSEKLLSALQQRAWEASGSLDWQSIARMTLDLYASVFQQQGSKQAPATAPARAQAHRAVVRD